MMDKETMADKANVDKILEMADSAGLPLSLCKNPLTKETKIMIGKYPGGSVFIQVMKTGQINYKLYHLPQQCTEIIKFLKEKGCPLKEFI